jgi:hypothetical protein
MVDQRDVQHQNDQGNGHEKTFGGRIDLKVGFLHTATEAVKQSQVGCDGKSNVNRV